MKIDIKPISNLYNKLSNLCYEPVASSMEEVEKWGESPEKRLNGYKISPLPKDLQPDVEEAIKVWMKIEELFLFGIKKYLNQSKNEFLDTFEKIRKSVIDDKIDAKLIIEINKYGNRTEEVIWNISWIDIFSWQLPKAYPDNSEKYIAIGKIMIAIMYFEVLNKAIQTKKDKISFSDINYSIKDIEARYKICNMYNLTSNNNNMNFQRNFHKNELTINNLFKKELKNDCINENVFMAIRNEYVDFYHKGGRLFKYDKGGFQTHIKYAAVIPKGKNDYLTKKELSSYKLATDFEKNYKRIKENCANYSGKEASGVSRLYHKYSYLSDSNIVVLDIEVSFQSLNDEKKQDRIDILLYNKETKTLRFVEAKHYSNKEIISETKPDVINQVKKYEAQIKNNRDGIIAAYCNYVKIINEIFNGDKTYLPLPLPVEVDNEVTLFIFGFDNDQKEGRLKEIEKQLSGINYYSVGNVKGIKITSLWNQAKVL